MLNTSERTKEALHAKVDSLCNAIFDERSIDPHGGNGYLSTILRTAKPHDTSEFSQIEQLDEARDYYTSAQKELTIREQTAGLIKTTQDLSTLIRDLQELWLFGGLDTLSDPADEEVNRKKAVEVAGMLEVLAKGGPVVGEEKRDGASVAQGDDVKKESGS